MKIKAIIFGATGMVGEGVLHECLKHPDVDSVLVINRRTCGVEHQKLTEIIHQDFHDLAAIENQLTGFNACYFCMGVSSMGMKKDVYKQITYDLTLNVANALVKLNPQMTFCYVSGAGTDGTESGRSMWATVKGKTENDLQRLPFKSVYNFRPGYIQPIKGLKNAYKIYTFTAPLYPLLKTFFSKYVGTLEELGLAMIDVTINGPDLKVLECKDIRQLAGIRDKA